MTNDLDLAVLLEHLKRAQSLFKSFFDGKGNAWISSAIAMLEPHVPKPRDEWMETFKDMLTDYGNRRAAGVLSDVARDILVSSVAVERERLRYVVRAVAQP